MSFGKNLQFLRKMSNKMTQEELADVVYQETQKYIAITITEPSKGPFHLIPNAYKSLMTHMKLNGIPHKKSNKILSCFEKEYVIDGLDYMDVYIAVE